MFKNLLIALFLLISSSALAQDSLQVLNYNRLRIENTGMKALGGWAVANIAVGTIGYNNTHGSAKYFNQMNIIWNVVNLGAAASGILSSYRIDVSTLNAAQSVRAQRAIERTFLINGVLDVVYIAAGLELHHHGNYNNSNLQRGYGSSITLQGAFLLLFDATMYGAEKHNENKLVRFLSKHQLMFDGKQIGMRMSW